MQVAFVLLNMVVMSRGLQVDQNTARLLYNGAVLSSKQQYWQRMASQHSNGVRTSLQA